jgi:hypothetical protein
MGLDREQGLCFNEDDIAAYNQFWVRSEDICISDGETLDDGQWEALLEIWVHIWYKQVFQENS